MKVLNGLKGTILRCRPILFGEVDFIYGEAFQGFIARVGDEILSTIPAASNTNYLGRFASPTQ